MDYILGLVAKVPTILWVIIGAVFVVPLLWRAFKKGAKVLGYVALGLALLFMFPSIGSSFMNEAELTWDKETGTLTNRNGTSISMSDIIEKGKDVKDITSDVLDNAGDIMDILGNGGDGGNGGDATVVTPEPTPESSDSGSLLQAKFDITADMIVTAVDYGMLLTEDMTITLEGGKFYLNTDKGNKVELSTDMVKALGILK